MQIAVRDIPLIEIFDQDHINDSLVDAREENKFTMKKGHLDGWGERQGTIF